MERALGGVGRDLSVVWGMQFTQQLRRRERDTRTLRAVLELQRPQLKEHARAQHRKQLGRASIDRFVLYRCAVAFAAAFDPRVTHVAGAPPPAPDDVEADARAVVRVYNPLF